MGHVKSTFSPNGHLRAEIMRQWQQLSASEIEESSRNVAKLVDVLQERYGYARRRAEQEVNLFYGEFQARLRMAA